MSKKARRACPGDWLAIDELARRSRRTLPWLWWWEEHLADDSFILLEQEGSVVGAFLAWPDESPVAWVRLAALSDGLSVTEWLHLTLPPILDGLRRRGTRSLAWMDYGGWAGSALRKWGFERLTDVITLAKFDRALPHMSNESAYLRPAADADIPVVVDVDRAAFSPHWWHSEDTVRRRAAAMPHFIVAEVTGSVVGYAEGVLRLPGAHLNRIAVHPDQQGHGVGALLLREVLCAFWQSGASQVSLNTQADNLFSQRLYRSFGFEPSGDVVTVWELHL